MASKEHSSVAAVASSTVQHSKDQPANNPQQRIHSSVRRKYASDEDALQGLTAFVRSLGVTDPAATEAELLMQAAPYMSQSLEANLLTSWTPEERARLDATAVPQDLDHQNRDHEYLFFKQMRKSLEQRLSRSSSTNSAARNSRDLHSLDSRTSREAVSSPDSMSPTCPQNVASLRAEQRRFNLGAVWGETGRDVLKALDTLPESDVLLDEEDIIPPDSPKYISLKEEASDETAKNPQNLQHTSSSDSPHTTRANSGGTGLGSLFMAKQWVTQKARRASFSLSRYWEQK